MTDQAPEPASNENSNFALAAMRSLLRSEFGANGKLPPERGLAERLGVSRRAIRRALEVLEAEGQIWRRQGSGTYAGRRPDSLSDHVSAIVSETDYMEIMEVRLRIEPQLAQLAALRARPADIARMRELAQKLDSSQDADSRELWDGALHRQIALAADNQLFLALFDVVNRVRQDEAWQALRERARSTAGSAGLAQAQHAAIIEAIAAHDPQRAGEAMHQHLMMLQEILLEQSSTDFAAAAPMAAAATHQQPTG
ncbi:FadR/GntR family transcriptional regulator [Plastorhodobacter daqingensis]|uniref:FadR/GntR family transcriptional regulator n=1 Tax=Plastorhodobacter daqingensis TaxID=1387281 RepID=A0ABW2URC2_9RHOB